MSKNRRTVSLDPDVDEYLRKDGVNASQLMNHLVRQEMSDGQQRELILEMRLEETKDNIEDVESKLDRLYTKRDDLESELEEVREQNRQESQITIAEAAEQLKPKSWLKSVPKEDQIPPVESDEIQHFAKQANMDAKHFRSEVINYLFSDGDAT